MASFEIIEFVDGKPRPFPAGVFPDGTTAASVITTLQGRYPNKKFQPRPIKDETRNWRMREQERFDQGLYTPLGLGLKEIDGHFAHRAINNPKNVAYTPDGAHGQTDKQISVSINKYLLAFYPKLTISERKKLVWDYSGEDISGGLVITQDANEIESVYVNGPRSCMADRAEDYNSPFHPVRVYGGPDLGVAYLKDDDRITARTVVWPDKKIFCETIYGDVDKLFAALKAEGYKAGPYQTAWVGARLSSEDDGNDYVCPFIDFADYVKWDGTYLVICDYESGAVGCGSTSGYTDEWRDNNYDDDY
jgi:hypothetical protein